jgi:hypothetical protein
MRHGIGGNGMCPMVAPGAEQHHAAGTFADVFDPRRSTSLV